jgi:NAD(P)-dependent dehydrogenase (short-subunit alcohol dehydrogenase family)
VFQYNNEVIPDPGPLYGKTCAVTGSTNGIGAATALGLARMGAQVIVLGRDAARAQAVLEQLQSATGRNDSTFYLADLSSQAEVRRLAEWLPDLDVLINNAGGVFGQRRLSVDGIEMTLATNHLAGFLLTNLLFQQGKFNPQARVINVSSFFHFSGWINFNDLQWSHFYFAPLVYAQSKLANVLFSNELARRVAGRGLSVNALDPGWVDTDLGRGPGLVSAAMRFFNRILGISPEKGAQTGLYLAASMDVKGVSGEYFSHEKIKSSSKAAQDRESAGRLWRLSARLTGLD